MISEKTKLKMSLAKKGKMPKNISLIAGWNKGLKMSEETRNKMSMAKLGKPGNARGHKFTSRQLKRLSKAHLGQRAWNTGLKQPQMSGENHFAWKGDKVGYFALHSWVRRILGTPMKCEFCERENLSRRSYHWANKSRDYNRDKSDWIRLCAKCHKAYDRNLIIA